MGFSDLIRRVPALRKDGTLPRRTMRYMQPYYAENLDVGLLPLPRKLWPHTNTRPFAVVGTEGLSLDLLSHWCKRLRQRKGVVLIVAADSGPIYDRLVDIARKGNVPVMEMRHDKYLLDSIGLDRYPVYVDPEKGAMTL